MTLAPSTRRFGLPVAALALAAFAFAGTPARAQSADIVDTAVAAGKFKTLAKALGAAGLVETLKGPGPFTVFAPTDAAFAKIPAAKLSALLANKAALTKVLTYHVLPGKITAKQVMAMTSPKTPPTVEGAPLTVKKMGGKVMVNNARVIKTDIMASNGVIHVIDTVLMPPMTSGKMSSGKMHPKM